MDNNDYGQFYILDEYTHEYVKPNKKPVIKNYIPFNATQLELTEYSSNKNKLIYKNKEHHSIEDKLNDIIMFKNRIYTYITVTCIGILSIAFYAFTLWSS